MLARVDENIDIRKNQSYLFFFVAFMTVILLLVVLYGYDWKINGMLDDNLLLLIPFVASLALFAFTMWAGFTLYTEFTNNGKKGIERFWRRYESGKLSKLYLVSMKNYEGELHLVFHFTGETWHPMINVYIPVKTATKLFRLLDRLLDDNRVMNMELEQFKKEVQLSRDEMEAFRFISYLLKTQGERLAQIMRMLKSFEKAEIDASEYLKEIFK